MLQIPLTVCLDVRCQGVSSRLQDELGCQGNLLLDRLAGATIIDVPYRPSADQLVDGKVVKGLQAIMEDYAKKLRYHSSNHNFK